MLLDNPQCTETNIWYKPGFEETSFMIAYTKRYFSYFWKGSIIITKLVLIYTKPKPLGVGQTTWQVLQGNIQKKILRSQHSDSRSQGTLLTIYAIKKHIYSRTGLTPNQLKRPRTKTKWRLYLLLFHTCLNILSVMLTIQKETNHLHRWWDNDSVQSNQIRMIQHVHRVYLFYKIIKDIVIVQHVAF